MLRRDLTLYRIMLQRLSLGELVALYERTLPDYDTLAQVIAEELNQRLSETLTAAV